MAAFRCCVNPMLRLTHVNTPGSVVNVSPVGVSNWHRILCRSTFKQAVCKMPLNHTFASTLCNRLSRSLSTFVWETSAIKKRFTFFRTACPSKSKQWGLGYCTPRVRYVTTGRHDRSRIRNLLIATYVSGAIGAALLVAIGFRAYGRFKKSARGIEEIDEPFYGRRKKYICRYRGYILPSSLIDTIANDVPWFEVRDDDIWVVGFPKSGTTWMQEIVYLLATDFDYESAGSATIEDRFPYLEYPIPGLKAISARSSPRFIKSHLPFSLLPKDLTEKKPKIIYMVRNPKDTAVSLDAFTRLQGTKLNGTIENFAEMFLKDLVIYGPWWKHVQEAWEQKNEGNVLFVSYEDLHRDLKGTVVQIAKFLGKPASEAQLAQMEQHVSFHSMQNNDKLNYSWYKGFWDFKGTQEGFMRKGKVGDWKNHFSPELANQFDAVTAKLESLGLTFVDDLPESDDNKPEVVKA